MQDGGRPDRDIVPGALLTPWAGGADDSALCAERLFATSATQVSCFFGVLVAELGFLGARPGLILVVFNKIEPASPTEPDVRFIFASASRASSHLKLIMPVLSEIF